MRKIPALRVLMIMCVALLMWLALSRRSRVFLIVALWLTVVIDYFVRRSTIIPPHIRVNEPYHRASALVVFLLIFIFLLFALFSSSGHISDIWGVAGLDVVPVVLFILYLFRRSAICGNGVWHWWKLHTWDEFESYAWTTRDDGAAVVLKQRERFQKSFASPRFVRLIVPLENSEAAKQLLEANLASSPSEPVKA
jgi:hypothetical protein